MPRGPKGEKRPADVIGNAVHVMRIATGEIEENTPKQEGLKGGRARAIKLTGDQRSEIARMKGISPAMAAGLSDTLWSMADLAAIVDAAQPKAGKRGPYKKENSN